MALYKTKPDYVRAFRWGVDPIPDWFEKTAYRAHMKDDENVGKVVVQTVNEYTEMNPVTTVSYEWFQKYYEIVEGGPNDERREG